MKRLLCLFSLIMCFTVSRSFAQDTLPRFTLTERGDKITISWVNPFQSVIQLNVQRSFDSLRNFTTIFSATSPQLPQNGFTDTRMPTNRIFYRIFYVLEGGSYFFTEAKRVGAPNTNTYTSGRDITNPTLTTGSVTESKLVSIRIKDTLFRQIPINSFRNFRDSILRQTKDTLLALNDSLVLLKPFVLKEVWRPSTFVYANRDGYINISLPAFNQRRYKVRFFEENGTFLFEINHVRDSPIILEKSNFIHAGWFLFELYEDERLKEKNKFYLPKDF